MSHSERRQAPNSRRADLDWGRWGSPDTDDPNPPIAAAVWVPESVRGEGDREVARLADAQKGFVHREQLLIAGLTRDAIKHRIRVNVLHPYHRDVYLFGRPEPEPLGLTMAAVLHFRGHAIVTHRVAVWCWGLLDAPLREPTVTVVGMDARSRPRLTVHRTPSIDRRDLRCRHGLPMTSPARSIVDFASEADDLELEGAVGYCIGKRLASAAEIDAALDRASWKPGAGRLRALLDTGKPTLTRSKAERLLRRLLRAADLPQPISNDEVLGHEVDLHWPKQRLIVEFDGWETHGTRAAFENDRRRDQRLVAAGYRVIRITWRQLEREPYAVVARLAQALAMAA